MDPIVKYPDFTQLDALSTPLREYARLKCEQGAETGAAALIGQLTETMRCTVRLLQELPDDAALSACEPNELDAIRALRAPAQRRLWEALPPEDIWMDKLEGALLGRIIGCLLGSRWKACVHGASTSASPSRRFPIGKKCKIRSFGTATAVSAANTGNARSGPLR